MADKKFLSHEDILAADDLKRATVDIPEWGGAVEVRELTAAQKYEVGMTAVDGNGNPNFERAARIPVMLAAYGLGLGPEHFDAIGAKSSDVIERIAEKVQELSGLEASDVNVAADFLPGLQNGASRSN